MAWYSDRGCSGPHAKVSVAGLAASLEQRADLVWRKPRRIPDPLDSWMPQLHVQVRGERRELLRRDALRGGEETGTRPEHRDVDLQSIADAVQQAIGHLT
jgi:hypothetical protein